MQPALLDLHDCNLQLWHGDNHVQSPGYALWQNNNYVFGTAARAAARLRPREINTRFWWQLGTEALQPALGPARHTADLVHAHLLDLHRQAGEPAEVVLAAPGSMRHEQLSLLLGIVQQCPFDAVGLVNRSVALGSLCAPHASLRHLEIQMHQAVLSELQVEDGELRLQRTAPLPGCGLLQLQERLVEVIAGAFVRQTRFDPRRKADSEQALYDALPGVLRELRAAGEANVEVNGYRARVALAQTLDAGARLFDALQGAGVDSAPDNLLLADPLTGLLPGMAERFPTARVLEGNAMRTVLDAHGERLLQRSEALDFISVLPLASGGASAAAVQTPAAPAAPRGPQPTHLLRDALALPLQAAGTALDNGCELYRGEDGWLLRGQDTQLLVNGAVYNPGQTLCAGDEIGLGAGRRALLITVEA